MCILIIIASFQNNILHNKPFPFFASWVSFCYLSGDNLKRRIYFIFLFWKNYPMFFFFCEDAHSFENVTNESTNSLRNYSNNGIFSCYFYKLEARSSKSGNTRGKNAKERRDTERWYSWSSFKKETHMLGIKYASSNQSSQRGVK